MATNQENALTEMYELGMKEGYRKGIAAAVKVIQELKL